MKKLILLLGGLILGKLLWGCSHISDLYEIQSRDE